MNVVSCVYCVAPVSSNAGAMSPKFGDGHQRKHYAPELLASVLFDVHDQHTQIITELDVKLNKWNNTIEKLYRKPTETEQKFRKKL